MYVHNFKQIDKVLNKIDEMLINNYKIIKILHNDNALFLRSIADSRKICCENCSVDCLDELKFKLNL